MNFKKLLIIIGIILALAIVVWYVISDMQVQKYKNEQAVGYETYNEK